MRYGWGFALILAGTLGIADAQERYVPVLSVVSRELGVSGSYNKSTVADTNSVSNFNISGHIGVITFMGLELEVESGYNRYHASETDTTAQNWTIAGNVLINVPLLSPRLTAFGLVGYGYDRTWERLAAVDPDSAAFTSRNSFKYWQYGIGAKYMLVANTALRVDYRWIRPTGLADDEPGRDREMFLIGISIFQ